MKMFDSSCSLFLFGTLFFAVGCAAEGRLNVKNPSAGASANVVTKAAGGDESTRLAKMRLSDDACSGYDLTPESQRISIEALEAHLDAKNIKYSVKVERENLHLFDLELGGSKATRLRVATLDTPRGAGQHLHKALLEHGQGYWGVHRSNLAVLGPPASPKKAAKFATQTGLSCWGVLTQAGLDDTFAIPGGYFEL